VNQNGIGGSVASGQATPNPIALSLTDAIQRGLKFNLGVLNTNESVNSIRAQRLTALSALLPNINASLTDSYSRVNLEAEGFDIKLPPSVGFSIPLVVTFPSVTGQGNLSQSVLNFQRLRNLRAADANLAAARLSVQDTRDLVVQAVGNAYLLIISDQARIDTAKAQVDTSQVLFQRAQDLHAAGTAPAIDQLRAEVQLRTDQQSLLVDQNQLEKDKIALGRVIGLPSGQEFQLSDRLPFQPLEGMTPQSALAQAFATRADYKAAEERVHAAELNRRAAVAEYYPTLDFSGSFGDAGSYLTESHNIFSVASALNVPIFNGGRIKADVEQADVTIRDRRNELGDLKGQIDQQVRTALLDLRSAADQVAVAQRNVELAHETLTQSRDRFTAGVTDNVEVVQAQQSVVTADANYIDATYRHNQAKIELARALGMTEQNVSRFLLQK
jgi:outer membrane protein TolC